MLCGWKVLVNGAISFDATLIDIHFQWHQIAFNLISYCVDQIQGDWTLIMLCTCAKIVSTELLSTCTKVRYIVFIKKTQRIEKKYNQNNYRLETAWSGNYTAEKSIINRYFDVCFAEIYQTPIVTTSPN